LAEAFKTYALVGVGARSVMYQEVFTGALGKHARLLAICDSNSGRLELAKRRLQPVSPSLGCYGAEDFDRMLAEYQPDCVIVTSMDCTHDDYICRSLRAGCDVITEKPMTIDERRCQKIIDAVRETGKSVRVTFNYRYSPVRSQVKELLKSGIIGRVLSVSFQWLLDTYHGADYFRRWHRKKANSGGLLVHKATHHFDLVNWWLSTVPVTVFARGKRVFYNGAQAKRYGLEKRGERCLECPVSSKCKFFLDLKAVETLKHLYAEQENYDGYFRDRCVFAEEIDIEDSVNVIVEYASGATLSYSLNAFCPKEGYRVEFNGTKGRLEQSCVESSYISGADPAQGIFHPEASSIEINGHFQEPYSVPVRLSEGSHGGGDVVMVRDIFGPAEPDPLQRSANYVQGAYSILTGIAANKSIATGRAVRVADLVTGLGEPGFGEMPA